MVGFGLRPSPEGWCLTAGDDDTCSNGVEGLYFKEFVMLEKTVYRLYRRVLYRLLPLECDCDCEERCEKKSEVASWPKCSPHLTSRKVVPAKHCQRVTSGPQLCSSRAYSSLSNSEVH